ncbi:MAG: ABC-2 family transporter protein [Candidatus Micrarchaeota archaeon]|nr:ABC-2 family transporter protein [Candidatus Micrarchaeota archaeon]
MLISYALIKSKLISNFAYRWESIGVILASAVEMLIVFYLWSAIFSWNNATEINGFTLTSIITYSVVAIFIRLICDTVIDGEMNYDVKTGDIIVMLSRPISIRTHYLSSAIGYFIFNLLFKFPLAFVIAILIGIIIPGLDTLLLFILSVFNSFLLLFTICFIIGSLAILLNEETWSLWFLIDALSLLFGGFFIPLVFFPDWIQAISYLLPFHAIYSTPLLIYVGKTSGIDALLSIFVQIVWIFALFIIGGFVVEKGLRRIEAQGG